MSKVVPVIDLSDFEAGDADVCRRVSSEIDAACVSVGFFSLIGHGVPDHIIDTAHRTAAAFFALPLETRETAAKPSPDYPYGYTPFSAEALNRSIGGSASPDLKETYNCLLYTSPSPRD